MPVPATLDQLQSSISTLLKKTRSISSSATYLGSTKETPSMRSRLNREKTEAQELVRSIAAGFQQLKPRYSSDLSFEKMASTFKTAMEQYEHALEECMRKERSTEPARAGEKRGGGRGGGGGDDLAAALNMRDVNVDVEMGGSSGSRAVMQRQEFDRTGIVTAHAIEEERLRELRSLESDFAELSESIQDFHGQTFEQREMVNSIAANVTSASEHVKKGHVELQKTREYQKSTRKKMCLIICLVVVVAALALGLGLGFGI